jgi:hypothetical protein
MPSPGKRVLVFVNKVWEAAPLVCVLRNAKAIPNNFPTETQAQPISVPLIAGGTKNVSPRLVFSGNNSLIEIWCIQDLMDSSANSSSSEEKARVIPVVVQNTASMVISVGTGAFFDDRSFNGCVVVGSNVFVHNPYSQSPNPASNWVNANFDSLVSTNPISAADQLGQGLRPMLESRLLRCILNAENIPVLLASKDYVAVSTVNVTDYAAYVWADSESLAAKKQKGIRQPTGSVETTHGVVRLSTDAPFLFISGIANRVGYFNSENAPRDYAQNFVAAHNAAIATAWLISVLAA